MLTLPGSTEVALETQLMKSQECPSCCLLDFTHEATRWTVFKQLEETVFIHNVFIDITYGG